MAVEAAVRYNEGMGLCLGRLRRIAGESNGLVFLFGVLVLQIFTTSAEACIQDSDCTDWGAQAWCDTSLMGGTCKSGPKPETEKKEEKKDAKSTDTTTSTPPQQQPSAATGGGGR